MKASDGSMKRVAFGESDHSTDVGSVDAVLENDGRPKKIPRFVYEGLMVIENDETVGRKSTNMAVACPEGHKTPVFSLPLLTDEDCAIPDDLYMVSANGKARPRHACFGETESKRKGSHRLVIVEGNAWDADPLVLRVEYLKPISATLALCDRMTEKT